MVSGLICINPGSFWRDNRPDRPDPISISALSVNLTNPAIVTQGTTPPATITISDNDAAPTVSIADVAVNENAGTAVFTVQLSHRSERSPQLTWSTADGTATAPGDYTVVAGQGLTFGPAEQSRSISVAIANDMVQEGNESFLVNLASLSGLAGSGNDLQASGTILDNDLGPAISDVSDTAMNEDGSLTVWFSVSSPQVSANQLTVTAASTIPGLLPGANIVLGGSGSGRSATLSPIANQFGQAVVTLTVADPYGKREAELERQLAELLSRGEKPSPTSCARRWACSLVIR